MTTKHNWTFHSNGVVYVCAPGAGECPGCRQGITALKVFDIIQEKYELERNLPETLDLLLDTAPELFTTSIDI